MIDMRNKIWSEKEIKDSILRTKLYLISEVTKHKLTRLDEMNSLLLALIEENDLTIYKPLPITFDSLDLSKSVDEIDTMRNEYSEQVSLYFDALELLAKMLKEVQEEICLLNLYEEIEGVHKALIRESFLKLKKLYPLHELNERMKEYLY